MKNRIEYRIKKKIREAADTATLVLRPAQGPLPYQAGQFITLIFSQPAQAEIRRSYSLSSAPKVDEDMAVTVKRQPNGLVSNYLVEKAQEGSLLTGLPPAGQFTLPERGAPPTLFLIGGGSGITPLFSILKYVLRHLPSSRLVLIDANRDERSIIFREQLLGWQRAYPQRLKSIHLLSNPREELPEGIPNLSMARGRLGNALLEELVRQNAGGGLQDAAFYLCGPGGLMLKSEMALRFMGYLPEQIYQEAFTITTPYRPKAGRFPDSEVELQAYGRQYSFPVPAGKSILEAAEKAGLELPYSCRSGICTSCAAHCLEGKVEMYGPDGLADSTGAKGLVLTCVGFPLSRRVRLVQLAVGSKQ